MKRWWMMIVVLALTLCLGRAEDAKLPDDVEAFIRQVVGSLLVDGNDVTFEIADSHVKEGVTNFIAYDKAFIFIIRKVAGKWTLIGMGG